MNGKVRVFEKIIPTLYFFLFLALGFSRAQATTYLANLYAPATNQSGRQAPINQRRFRDHCVYEYVRGSMRQAQQQSSIPHYNYNPAPAPTTHTIAPAQSNTTKPVLNTSKPNPDGANKPVVETQSSPPAPPAISTHQRQELARTQQFLAQKQPYVPISGSYFLQEREYADKLLSQALDNVLAGNNSITQEHYSLDFETEQLLQKNDIDIQDFTHCSGNAATLQKHREIIVLLNKITDLRDQSPTNKAFQEILYHFLDGASLSNKELKLFASCSLTNFCWAGLEYAYHAAHGFKTGTYNTFSAAADPIGTGAHILQAGIELGRFLGNFCSEMVAYQAHMSYQEICALNNVKPDHQLADLKEIKSRLHATQSIGAILDRALKDFGNKSGPQRVGMLTELGTEYFLSGPVAHRVARGARLLCGSAAKQAKNIMRAMKKGKQFEHAVATAGGLELRIARETLTFFENAGEALPGKTFTGTTETSALHPAKQSTGCWCMSEQGCTINNRYYTKHALERMAPATEKVILELEQRALKEGFPKGSKKFKSYIDARNIPPMVIENTIQTTKAIPGKYPKTFDHIIENLKVVVNEAGDVVTVIKH